MGNIIKTFAEGSALKHTQELKVATAQTRDTVKWRNQQISMEEFVGKLANTVRTKESQEEYMAASKADQDNIKDVGGFVGGLLKGGRRGKSDVQNRSLLALDIDYGTTNALSDIETALGNTCYTIYSTHKHTAKHPRLRLIVYPDRAMLPAEYQAVMRKVAALIDIEMFDSTTYDINRLMYWPSTSADGDFVFMHNDAPFLPVDNVLASYADWQDVTEWPVGSRENKVLSREIAKQADPMKKPGVVGAYCRNVTIHEAMELTGEYRREGENRYTYIAGTTSNGVVIYDEKFAYSNHDSDPAGGQTVNAFDMVRIHRFGHLDKDARPSTSDTKLPSYTAMLEFARDTEGVRTDMVAQGLSETTQDDFDIVTDEDAEEPTEDLEWLGLLQTDNQGAIKPTFYNATLIMGSDPKLCDRMTYNEMSYATEIGRTGEPWGEKQSYQVRRYVGQRYGVDFPEGKVEQAIDDRAFSCAFHPVREYLTGLKWDGTDRLDALFIQYLGVPDTLYSREVARCTLIAAVARAMQPGHKFDQVTVLGGPQGIGKSTFIQLLAKSWYAELSSFDLKIAAEEMTGAWIMEMNEMAATNRSELEAQKAFISATQTKVRLPYARRAITQPRQCIFIATTNQQEYLKDSTGNRRWWPLECGIPEGELFDREGLVANLDQIWAEAYERWAMGEDSQMSAAATDEAQTAQARQLEADPWEGMISEWLATEADEGRYERLSMTEIIVKRDKVCATEIWQDCLDNKDVPKRHDANRISAIMKRQPNWEKHDHPMRFGDRFGRQKGWFYNCE